MARDVKSDIIDFLRSHVDTSVIDVPFDKSDDIGFAAYDDVDQSVYVTPASEDGVVVGGGESRYSGMDGTGKGGIQDVVTTVQVDCWGGDRDDDVYTGVDSHPDIVANALSREVHRVLFESGESNDEIPTPDGYEWVNAEPPVEANDVQETPTKYRRYVVAVTKHTEKR